MTNKNPLGIDFAEITKAAERRVTNLECIGTLLSLNVSDMLRNLNDTCHTYEMLEARWDALDPEGREMLPTDVRHFLGNVQHMAMSLNGLINNDRTGITKLIHYRAPAAPAASTVATIAETSTSDLHTGEYRIEIAFASTSDEKTITEALQEVYDGNGPAGMFKVKTNGVFCWITFERELSDDRDYILQHIAKDMTLNTAQAAIKQLEGEFMESINDPDHEGLVGSILEALAVAQVEWPQP